MTSIDESKPLYRNREVLEELYVENRMTMKEIADLFDCSPPTIKRWLDRHGIPIRNQAGNGKEPWHSEERLRELYVEKSLSVPQIARRFDCHVETVNYWLGKFEIAGRKPRYEESDPSLPNHYWRDGYEIACANQFEVRIHRLVAVAEYGLDYVENWNDYHIHHKNGIKWDNRPENLEVVTPTEHAAIHNQGTKDKAKAT